MDKQVGNRNVSLFHTGTNNFPHMERIRYSAFAPCDGPFAVVTKDSPSVLQIYHRIGVRLGKRSFGNREFILSLYWIRHNTLVAMTSKGLVYFLSFHCTDYFPAVRVSNVDIFRAFLTESCVVVQQERSELLIYPIDALQRGHVVFQRLSVDFSAEQIFSSTETNEILLYIASPFSVKCVSYTSGIIVSEPYQTIAFEHRVETLEPDSSVEKVAIFVDSTLCIYSKHLDRRLARIKLPSSSLLIMGMHFIARNMLAAIFKNINGSLCVFLANLTDNSGISLNSIHISRDHFDRYIGSVREIDGLRLHTSERSYFVKLIDSKVLRFQSREPICSSTRLKKSWKQSITHANDEIDFLLPLLQIEDDGIKLLLDCAITECLEISMLASTSICRKDALCAALYGMKFSRADWIPMLLKVRSFNITCSLLQKCTFSTFTTKDQLDSMPVKYLINRCVEYGEYKLAWTLGSLHNQPPSDINKKWAKFVVGEKALSDQEVLDEIFPKIEEFSQTELEQLLLTMKQSGRNFALQQTLQSFSQHSRYRLMLFRLHIFSEDYLSALRLAEELGDADSIVHIILHLSSRDKVIMNEEIPFTRTLFQSLHILWNKKDDQLSDKKRRIKHMSQKWEDCITKMRRMPTNEWTTLVNQLTIDLEQLNHSISGLRMNKKYMLWISNTIHLLSKQCQIAKQTGNLGFLGKTFNETVIMCHSYKMENTIQDLSRYFKYGEETNFWLYLLYLCEIKDWNSADLLINSKITSRRLNIGPGATEVLWEYGRYDSNVLPITKL